MSSVLDMLGLRGLSEKYVYICTYIIPYILLYIILYVLLCGFFSCGHSSIVGHMEGLMG